MGLREILQDKDTSAAAKLEEVSKIVTACREAYGNTEAEIAVPKVNTASGIQSLSMVDDEGKVGLAKAEIGKISTYVAEIVEATAGAVFDSEFAANVAMNPVLTNLGASTGSKYL